MSLKYKPSSPLTPHPSPLTPHPSPLNPQSPTLNQVTGLDIPSISMVKLDEGFLPPLEILGPTRPQPADRRVLPSGSEAQGGSSGHEAQGAADGYRGTSLVRNAHPAVRAALRRALEVDALDVDAVGGAVFHRRGKMVARAKREARAGVAGADRDALPTDRGSLSRGERRFAGGRRAEGDCDGLSGVCRNPAVTQGSPYAGTVNQARPPPNNRLSRIDGRHILDGRHMYPSRIDGQHTHACGWPDKTSRPPVGLSGVCRGPSVTQGSPYAGTVNQARPSPVE